MSWNLTGAIPASVTSDPEALKRKLAAMDTPADLSAGQAGKHAQEIGAIQLIHLKRLGLRTPDSRQAPRATVVASDGAGAPVQIPAR